MKRLASLTSRLVATTVLLVAVVSLLIAGAATLALHSYLGARLDRDVLASLGRLPQDNQGPFMPPDDHDRDNHPFDQPRIGLLSGVLHGPSGSWAQIPDDDGTDQLVSSDTLTAIEAVPADGHPHDVNLPGYGEYRIALAPTSFGATVAGLPASSVDGPVSQLILWEVLVGVLGIAAAAGAGIVLVRRQLRPLREVAETAHTVAELPLATGDIELAERVPDRLTDENTEVGQVGAALNTLLAHVESSLNARHESEQQVRQFVADASHELRTPLTTIAGYTELARRRPDDPAHDADRARQGRGGVGADDLDGRGPPAAGPARLRTAARAEPSTCRACWSRRSRTRACRPGPPVAARPTRGVDRGRPATYSGCTRW